MAVSVFGTGERGRVNATMLEEQMTAYLDATGVPAKPTLQHDQYTGDTDGEYTISVNMWYGNNGTSYILYEKRGKIGEYKEAARGVLTDGSPLAQNFTIDITGRTIPGTYYYYLELINEYGSTVSDEISLSVGSTTTAKLILDRIDADEVVNQYVMEQGTDTFHIDYAEAEQPQYTVLSSNTSVVKADIVNGDNLRLEAVAGGRTGIRLEEKETGEVRYFGVRVKEADGTLADQTSYLALGQVSEDSDADLNFWKSISEDDTNKRMDIRYIYINGGPVNGWRSWSGKEPEKRVKSYITESLKLGMVPYFVYYNIPDGSESYDVDYEHINDVEYMAAYYEDLLFFLETCDKYDAGEQVGIILEPDFLGYMMQNGTFDPEHTPAAGVESAYSSNILKRGVDPDFPNTLEGLVKSINYIISTRYPSATFGWQFNTWGFRNAPSKGLMHATESMGIEAGREFIRQAATETAQFYMSAGILEYGADFISIDKYGLDGAYQGNAAADPANSSWLWNSDLWNNYLFYTKTLHETTGFPVTLWQIPVGHLNHSLEADPYQGGLFPDLDNTEQHYEDSAPTFFFGDTFEPGSDVRMEYFSRNDCGDSKVHVNGNTVTYDSHMEEAKEAGITCILFGAGVGSSTDAVGEPPTDSYWWITKAQRYYQNLIPLDTVMLSVNQTEGILKVGEQVTLAATVEPVGTAVAWNSQNPAVATVEDGVVTAIREGKTVIYVKAGNETKEYEVTVVTDDNEQENGESESGGDQSGSGTGSSQNERGSSQSQNESGSGSRQSESGSGSSQSQNESGGNGSQSENETEGSQSGSETGGNQSESIGNQNNETGTQMNENNNTGESRNEGKDNSNNGSIETYAKWTKVTTKKTSVKKLQSRKKGRLTVNIKKKNGVNGYKILCARDKQFKKGRKSVSGYKTTVTFKKLKSGKTYYVKVCTYKLDSAGEKVYSKYSKVKKCKVK